MTNHLLTPFFEYICTVMRSHRKEFPVVTRAFAFLMALYLFNFSIDSRDAYSDAVAEDLSVNDIESVYEFLTEGVLGVENAVEEHDEHDQEEGGSFEFKKDYVSLTCPKVQLLPLTGPASQRSPIDYSEPLVDRATKINSPPPRG